MTFQIELTATPELLGAVNRLADAIMGGKQVAQTPIAQEQRIKTVEEAVLPRGVVGTVAKAVESLEEVAQEEAAEVVEVEVSQTDPLYSEEELMNMSVDDMTKLLKTRYNVNPSHTEGKNTNRKLRLLVLEAQSKAYAVEADKADEVWEVEEEEEVKEVVQPKTPAAKQKDFQPTVAMAREQGVRLRNAGKIPEFKAVLSEYGVGSISEAADLDNFADFYNDLLNL